MSFEVSGEAYGRFMGRFSEPLAEHFAELVGVHDGQRALDVGCGPGALTAVLAGRLGAQNVSAVDPSASFVEAVRTRLPEVEVQRASAEQLPFPNASFDLVLAQLVVHFMSDPVAGIAEMARVARPGATVAASVWDAAGGRWPQTAFWRAVCDLDPSAENESIAPGEREGDLVRLFREAGLSSAEQSALTVRSSFPDIDAWWTPFTLGVGPAGGYVAGLDEAGRAALKARCAELLPSGPFEVEATAWVATARR